MVATEVASRLKQYQPSARILLVEAGPDVSNDPDILQFSTLNFIGGKFDWGYKSTPQKGYDGRQIDVPSGRALGGGSVINGCGWFRGSRSDYDSWAEVVNDQRWSYEGQLPYFKKTEKWYNDKNSDEHGRSGTMHIESPISTNRIYPLASTVEKAWEEFHVRQLPHNDSNAGANIGFGELNENRAQGARQIAPLAYPLDGVTVLTNTLVNSIIVDASNKATGIQLGDGTKVHADEVIVAAGAYRTPQLLMLSGLGPKETLDRHDIAVKADIPDVGQNFNDHVMVYLNWKLKDPSKGFAIGSSNEIFAEPRFATGTPLSHVAYTEVPRAALEAAIAKDEGVNGGVVDPNHHHLLKRDWALMENIVMYLAIPPVPTDGTHISTAQMALKPTSRGSVTIASADPADAPVIDPNYFATEVDRTVWRHSLRRIAAFMAGEDTVLGREVVAEKTPFPGFERIDAAGSSDAYLDSRVKAHGVSTFHGCGTCSMGKVVDTELRVKGVENLRIIDASVIPIAVGAHIQATVYALAEQAAVIIAKEKGVAI
ncbi:putative GMC oxidoreductase [Hypoxylon sp. CI-4A]|nr:putative GMC oxidoreductase [Hypoxylon sp. CI-4A]